MPVFNQTKRIFENHPLTNKYGQYNYGKIEEKDSISNLGYQSSGYPEETHLYTTVETGSLIPETQINQTEIKLGDIKKGMVNGLGSSWELVSQQTYYTNSGETEGDWRNVQHAVMYIDGASNVSRENCQRGLKAFEWSETFILESNRDVGHITKSDIECRRTNGDLFDNVIVAQSDDYNVIASFDAVNVNPDTGYIPGTNQPNIGGDDFYWGTMMKWDYSVACTDTNSQGSGIVDPSRNKINNFHLKSYNNNPGIDGQTTVNDITVFNRSLRKDNQSNKDGYIFTSVRIGGDEKEKRGGSRTDERDRGCGLTRLDKSCLAKTFFQTQQHADYPNNGYSISWSNGDNKNVNNGCLRSWRFFDNYGDHKGYKRGHRNDKGVLTYPAGGEWRIESPTFNIMDKIKSYADGGANASYVDMRQSGWWCVDANYERDGKTPRVGLNPRYNFDAIGLPSDFKNNFDGNGRLIGNAFLKFEKIDLPFRAISNIKNSISAGLFELDLQNYYTGESAEDKLNRVFSSAPAQVTLDFDIAKDLYQSNPNYVNFSSTNSDEYKNFDYWFFVVNWDWKTGDPKTISEVGESFPTSTAEMEALNNSNIYKLFRIGQKEELDSIGSDTTCNQYFESFKYSICSAEHTYVTSGIKVVKAMIFRTVKVDTDIPLDSNGWDMTQFTQAVDWQLATVKLNLSEEGLSLEADFGDLGGDDYTYLPYPGIFINNLRDENDEIIEAPSGKPYNSAHMVIGGLHEQSNYVKSIKTIRNSDNFDMSEGTEKKLLQKSYDLSPLGNLDELGKFPGKLNLSQIRFFDKPFDIKRLLGISYIGMEIQNFKHFLKKVQLVIYL